jgi:NADH:ubiquinone oxidoreductase subunit E
MDTLNNVLSLDDYRTKKETAEVMAYMEEVKSMISRQRQDAVLIALHTLLEIEREFGFLSEQEIIEIANIFHRQVGDGITIS